MRSPPILGVCFPSGDWLLGRLYAFGATSSSPFFVSHRLFVSLLVCESSFYLDTRPRRLVACGCFLRPVGGPHPPGHILSFMHRFQF